MNIARTVFVFVRVCLCVCVFVRVCVYYNIQLDLYSLPWEHFKKKDIFLSSWFGFDSLL